MNILIIGAGGREHAIGKKIKQSPKVNKVYCAPGNPGMTLDGIEQVDIHELDHQKLIEFAKKKSNYLDVRWPRTTIVEWDRR